MDYLFVIISVDSFFLWNEVLDVWSRSLNWVGFIVVCIDEQMIKKMGWRDILLVWCGIVIQFEWVVNFFGNMVLDVFDE